MRKLLRSPVVKVVARWANKEPFIWDGVYESFDQVPVMGQGFASEAWLADMERYTRTAVTALRNEDGVGIPEKVPQYHAQLSLLLASMPAQDRPVRVLDFGGGMGIGVTNVRRCMAAGLDVEYLIVDNEESCKRGRELLKDFSSVKFMSELPRDVESVDVIVLSAVLQFVEEYEKLLSTLAAFRPSHWFFGFLPAGDIPTFASAQLNVPGSVLPVWFFNVNELTQIVEKFGYQLAFKSALDRVFDMSNFPLTHQLPHQCNLLFRRR
ncbi:MAG TPA: methyltransferase, TIGR04325 family [Pyrinomonadaceae bacterium]|nr:methyltransferase, TIGR04325 family [Pyrinomonadaceae bacterium]